MNLIKGAVVCCLFFSGIEITLGSLFSEIYNFFDYCNQYECCDARWVNLDTKGKKLLFMMSERVGRGKHTGFYTFLTQYVLNNSLSYK